MDAKNSEFINEIIKKFKGHKNNMWSKGAKWGKNIFQQKDQ